MTSDYAEEYRSRIRLLAAGLKSHRPGKQTRLVLFLGAGAPREAGLPLADELKNDVISQVFKGSIVPKEAREGRLEDLMQLLQTSLGNDSGYELVARIIREFKEIPASYNIIGDLIVDGYVEAVVTTNFDLLFDIMEATTGIKFHFMVDDNSFEGDILKEETVIAKLHGSALDPATMKGSWTDVKQALPARRQEVLADLMANQITVFVGYSAKDGDVIPTLEAISELNPKPIWWVNPTSQPTVEIEHILSMFGPSENYLPVESQLFFHDLAEELAPPVYADDKQSTRSQELVSRIQAGSHVSKFLDERELRNMRTTKESDFEKKVNEACWKILDSYILRRSVLNQKASQSPRLSDIDTKDFDSVVQLLKKDGTLQYHCTKVGSPGVGSLELALQPVKAGRGGRPEA